jgi:hypothetical protein
MEAIDHCSLTRVTHMHEFIGNMLMMVEPQPFDCNDLEETFLHFILIVCTCCGINAQEIKAETQKVFHKSGRQKT